MKGDWKLGAMWGGTLGGVLGVVLGASLMVSGLGGARPKTLGLALGPTRPLEARLTPPEVDMWRPYDARATREESFPLELEAQLETLGDYRGLAVLRLMRGEHDSAEDYLQKADSSPDVNSDRAVSALAKQKDAEALELLDGVLRLEPRHPQALWNRGLVLRALELWVTSARSFEAVAELGEKGWAKEARERAAEQRGRWEAETASWEAAELAHQVMMAGQEVPLEEVRKRPTLFRMYFYDALRVADSSERLAPLEPVARVLDAHAGGTVLRDTLRWVRSRDFERRAPLARMYQSLLEGQPPRVPLPEYLKRLRSAGERDILLGVFWQAKVTLKTKILADHLEEYQALAWETKDPWFLLLADYERASVAISRGELPEAERILLPALEQCRQQRMTYRCAWMAQLMSHVDLKLNRPTQALAHAREALTLIRQEKVWAKEPSFLAQLGQVERLMGRLALARALLEESLARAPEDPEACRRARENEALLLIKQLDQVGARRKIEEAKRCGPRLKLAGLATLAALAHRAPAADDEAWVVESLAALRSSGRLDPGTQAHATSVEGAFFLELGRASGESLLRRALSEAEALKDKSQDARKARVYSYSTLLMTAGRAGRLTQALELFQEEAASALPERCLLAVTVDDERTLAVIRGPEGAVEGAYDASRTWPVGEDVTGLVPTRLVEALRPCERVQVLARPPLHGRRGLLPPEMAWSYHQPRAATNAVARDPLRLVVTDVRPPESLHLPELPSWGAPPRDAEVLAGTFATPKRVLEAMRRATEIEIHAHGVVNLDESEASMVVLTPDASGRYALVAPEVRRQRLRGAPLVILASCRAAHTGPTLHEPFSLPMAFIDAGARAVLAATVDVPDAEARPFFDEVRLRVQDGVPVANALRDVRQQWLERDASSWVGAVLLFD